LTSFEGWPHCAAFAGRECCACLAPQQEEAAQAEESQISQLQTDDHSICALIGPELAFQVECLQKAERKKPTGGATGMVMNFEG
jgi:hypothetical protein